jgi:hypothetical protein
MLLLDLYVLVITNAPLVTGNNLTYAFFWGGKYALMQNNFIFLAFYMILSKREYISPPGTTFFLTELNWAASVYLNAYLAS